MSISQKPQGQVSRIQAHLYHVCALFLTYIWARMRENLSSGVGEQQSCRPACASAQSDQRLCYSFLESIISGLAMSEITII